MLMSRQPVWIGWGRDLLYFYNDPYFSIIGGKHPWALGRPTREVWGEIWNVIGPMLDTAMSGDEGTYVESQLLLMERNGYPEETYYTFSYSPIPDDNGEPGGIFCANSDDTRGTIGQRELALLRELASESSKANSPSEACDRCAVALATDGLDLPFAAIYMADEQSAVANLQCVTGIDRGHPLAPETIAFDDKRFHLGRARAEQKAHVLTDLGPPESLPCGAWAVPPTAVAVLPMVTANGGFLLAGLSPYRLLAGPYEGFLGLVAGQVAAAVADAEATEMERKRVEALAELDRAKTAFFANVSHEFRTPLTLMLGPLEDVLSKDLGALSPRVELELETVRRNGQRLQKLVNTLLDVSRLEAGRLRAEFRPTDVGTFTSELSSSFGSAIENAKLSIVIDCPALVGTDRPYVDQDLWEKLVLNLVSNAYKHTFEGNIGVSVHKWEHAIRLQVIDTGIGIPTSELPHIFERFRRVEGSRSRTHEGSGIGLALVQEIVKLHGGEISASSETEGDNRGTAFTVTIPLGRDHLPDHQVVEDAKDFSGASSEAARYEAAQLDSVSAAPSPGLQSLVEVGPTGRAHVSGARVLVADDNADMRSYIARLLASDYVLETVPDGEAALESIRKAPPDLLITDVMMPRMDGFQLLKAVRTDPAIAHLPVIMLSARAGEEARIDGLDAGADDYLVKPFSARELLARVDSALTLARMRQEHAQEQQRRDELLRNLFMIAPAIICVLKGPDHVFELANPFYLSIVGRKEASEILHKPIRLALPEVVGQGFIELLDRVYTTGEPFIGKEASVMLDRHGDGSLEEILMDFAYIPSRDVEGNIDGVFVHAVDVTDQVHARAKVEELAQELEERVAHRTSELLYANEQLQGFTYSVAHDLRQQIRGISTNAAMVLQDAGDRLSSDDHEHLTRSVRAARKLGELVDDLLDYARLGRAAQVVGTVDLSAIATEISGLLKEWGRCEEGTEFVIGPTPTVTGDAAMLRIVLENLLDNACKYSRNSPQPRIEFGSDDSGYFVKDNGIGFNMAYVDKLFKPFERLHNDESISGTGIGLANVRRIVEKHGGRVWAEGEPSKGATFRFALPT